MVSDESISPNGASGEDMWTIVPGGRVEHVRWLVSNALTAFPNLFDDLDDFMTPPRPNHFALQAGYGPYHGDPVQMMKFILVQHHKLARKEVEAALRDLTPADTKARRVS
jgi:hypothetical protein